MIAGIVGKREGELSGRVGDAGEVATGVGQRDGVIIAVNNRQQARLLLGVGGRAIDAFKGNQRDPLIWACYRTGHSLSA